MRLAGRFYIVPVVLLSSFTTALAYVPLLRTREISPDNTCGTTGVGGSSSAYKCPDELPCCSVNGFCGSTPEYCCTDSGCQPDYGICKESQQDPADGSAGDSGGTVSGGPDDPERCGPGVGNCAAGKCCSGAGFCGTTSDHCKAPDCQPTFGPACDANATPAGPSTSGIPRVKSGNVLYGSSGIFDCQKPGDMALTFDDGPYIYTAKVLDLLDQYGAKGTFFVTGNNNGKGPIDNTSLPWPDLIKRMYNSDHQIASHTWSHADLCNITSSERKEEMYKLEMAVRNVVGAIPTYMRPPYSSCTAECGCEQDMEELGYHITYFDLDTSDYLNTLPTTISNSLEIFSAKVNASNPANDDFLVIAHDIHQTTAEVLVEYMLKEMQAKGFKGVTVGECLGESKEAWYRLDTAVALGDEN